MCVVFRIPCCMFRKLFTHHGTRNTDHVSRFTLPGVRPMYNKVDARIVEDLRRIVGEGNVLVDAEEMEPYTHDEVVGLRADPEVVVRVTGAEQVAEHLPAGPAGARAGHAARRGLRPERRGGARLRRHRPLAGEDEPHPGDRQGEPDGHRRAGGHHRRHPPRGGGRGAVLSARPGQPRLVHHRRQHRRGRRRPAGRQVRRDQGLRVRPGGGAALGRRSSPAAASWSRTSPATT